MYKGVYSHINNDWSFYDDFLGLGGTKEEKAAKKAAKQKKKEDDRINKTNENITKKNTLSENNKPLLPYNPDNFPKQPDMPGPLVEENAPYYKYLIDNSNPDNNKNNNKKKDNEILGMTKNTGLFVIVIIIIVLAIIIFK